MSKIKPNGLPIRQLEYPFYIFGDSEMGLRKLILDGYGGKVKLIYIDPPYFSGSDFAFDEKEVSAISKAKSDFKRVFEISKELLCDDGFFLLQSNYKCSSGYLNHLFEIFGKESYINEIIWQYKKGLNRISKLVNCHDNIYVFSKSSNYSINTKQEEKKSPSISDVWTDIETVKSFENDFIEFQRTKPTKLFLRLLDLFSNENDIVIDAFAGSGSFLISAEKQKRKVIGIDNSLDSFIITTKRFEQIGINLNYVKIEKIQSSVEDKKIDTEEVNLLIEDKRDFGIPRNIKVTSSEKIIENIEKSEIERINKALEIPIDFLKKIFFFIAFSFPCYLLINLISLNFYWLFSFAAFFTFICILFVNFAFRKPGEKNRINWKSVFIIVALNLIIAFAANQTIKQKEIVTSFKEIIK